MFDFNEKRRLRRIIFSRITLVLLIVVMGLLGRGAWGVYEKAAQTGDIRESLEARASQLEARKSDLNHQLERLHSDRGVEAEVRQKYGVAREGEELIILVDRTDRAATTTDSDTRSVWQRVKDFFSF